MVLMLVMVVVAFMALLLPMTTLFSGTSMTRPFLPAQKAREKANAPTKMPFPLDLTIMTMPATTLVEAERSPPRAQCAEAEKRTMAPDLPNSIALSDATELIFHATAEGLIGSMGLSNVEGPTAVPDVSPFSVMRPSPLEGPNVRAPTDTAPASWEGLKT